MTPTSTARLNSCSAGGILRRDWHARTNGRSVRGATAVALKLRTRFVIRKALLVIVGVISFVGTILGIVSTFTSEEYRIELVKSSLNIDISYPYLLTGFQISVFGMSLSGLLYITYVQKRRLDRLSTIASDMAHLARAKTVIYDLVLSDPGQSLNEHLRCYLGILESMFSKYTATECAVCVKMLMPGHNPQNVKTLVRDPKSLFKRAYVDKNLKSYPYSACTVFKEIFKESPSIFLSNNLKRISNFQSANESWKKHYNAVLAIAISDHEQATLDNTIGFLCVDNFIGRFDENFCKEILIACACDVFQLFTVYYKITGRQQLDGA